MNIVPQISKLTYNTTIEHELEIQNDKCIWNILSKENKILEIMFQIN